MLRHIAGHMAQAVLLLISVVVLIFCLLQLIPGDPIQAMVGDMRWSSASSSMSHSFSACTAIW